MLDSPLYHPTVNNPIFSRLVHDAIITAELSVEVNQVAFNMRVEHGKVLVTIKRLSDFTALIKGAFNPAFSAQRKSGAIEALLDQTNLTIYAQNYLFGIMGPKANPILKRLFYAYAARMA